VHIPIVATRASDSALDALFPIVGDPDVGTLRSAELGDEDVLELRAHEVAVRAQFEGHVRDIVHVRRHGSKVLVTDSGVMVSCVRVVGASVVAGDVRYPWLVAVGASLAAGRHDLDAVRLIVRRWAGDFVVFTLSFDEGEDVCRFAEEIAHRAARDWLRTHPAASTESADRWRTLLTARLRTTKRGEFAFLWSPESARVPAVEDGDRDLLRQP
jgi:hypothetical protein